MRNGECGMGSEEWENEMEIQIGNGKWEFFRFIVYNAE